MGYDDGPPAEDLTPGDFDGDAKPTKVETDSLGSFGTSYARSVQTYFFTQTQRMSGMVYSDAAREKGSRSFGNSDTIQELISIADYAKRAAEGGQQLAIDLSFGNMALGNAAAWMAEKYGVTDGFNAVGNASVINDAFSPPAGAKLTTGAMRDQVMSNLADTRRRLTLPVVDPSDVKFWNMSRKPDGSPYVAGEDYIIAGDNSTYPGDPGEQPADPNDPTSGNPNGNNNDQPSNEFYRPAEEDDLEDTSPAPYTPPEAPEGLMETS